MNFLKTTLFEKDVEYLKRHNPILLKRIKQLIETPIHWSLVSADRQTKSIALYAS